MKILFINPLTKTVTELDVQTGGAKAARELRLDQMQSLVGGRIERVPWNNIHDKKLLEENDLWCNEEYLYQGYDLGFVTEWWPDPILGCAIVTGHDGKGKSQDCTMTEGHLRLRWCKIEREE